MSDDRLIHALRRLGDQELSITADRTIRGRLETAWTTRSRGGMRASFTLRRFAPVLAAFVLVAGLGGSALGAGADSPLWDTRLALESAGAYLRLSTDDRVAYLLDLVQSRTEEAARQEVLGNAGAAEKARAAAASAVVEVNGSIPHVEVALPTPPPATPVVASASPTPTPAVSPSPSPSRPPSATPTAQPPSSVPPTRTNAPITATEPPHTPSPSPTRTPTPTPTSTKPTVTITGTVRDQAGATVTGACITSSPTIPTSTSSCITKTTNGTYAFTAPVTPGQTITLYAYSTTTTGVLAGSATSPATAPYTVMPQIALTPRK